MTELERHLIALGAEVEFPPTPDIAGAARRRLAERAPVLPFWQRRRTLVVALAFVALAVATALAVPPARTAILRFFGLEGANVRLVDELPRVGAYAAITYGERVTLAEARRRVDHAVLAPAALGATDAVYADTARPGEPVTLVYRSNDAPRLLVTQFSGEPLIEKVGEAGQTQVEPVHVRGERGLWIHGPPHVVFFRDDSGRLSSDEARTAGNTLLWQRGGLTIRMEMNATKGRALALARSFG